MRDNEMFQNRPITMNHNNNLLEIEEHMYILDDVKKPNVFRNMFPYSEIPKIPFNDRIVTICSVVYGALDCCPSRKVVSVIQISLGILCGTILSLKGIFGISE